MARPSVVGPEILEQVNKLTSGGMKRTEAFDQIAKDSGRAAGTVAANFYRESRKNAKPSRPRPQAQRATVSTNQAEASDLDQMEAEVGASLHEAFELARAERAKTEQMRSKLDQLLGSL